MYIPFTKWLREVNIGIMKDRFLLLPIHYLKTRKIDVEVLIYLDYRFGS